MRYISFALLFIAISALSACGGKQPPVVDTSVEPLRIAVNSEFFPTARILANQFTTNTQIAVELTQGTDTELVSKIEEGGDFDVFMSTDMEHPKDLIENGKAMSEGASIYALGVASLYSKQWKLNWNAVPFLESGQFSTLSVPNPQDNSYGRAGIDALNSVNVYEVVENKLVYTQSETETLEQVKTMQVDAGFIKFSSLSDANKRWAWVIPQEIYDPIEQGAVLINKDQMNSASEIWMGYLNSDQARSIIQQSGYGIIDNQALSSN